MTAATLLLDGLWGRPRRYRALRRDLEKAGVASRVFQYDSSGAVPLERPAERFIAEVRGCGAPVDVVAHSMGGVVVRTARLLDPALPLRRCAFVNVPHRGTLAAYLLLPLAGVPQMRPGSRLLRRLDAAPWDVPTLAVWCPGDLIVVPGCSARWPRAARIVRCNVPAHAWWFRSRALRREVVRFLTAEYAGAVCPGSPNS